MEDHASYLINGYLDELLTEKQHNELAVWIKASDEHARRFSEAVLLHDRLRSELNADAARARGPEPVTRYSLRMRLATRVWVTAGTLCLILIVVAIWWQGLGETRATAASVELNRIVEAAQQPVDRTYMITAVESGELPGEMAAANRARAKPPVDGALLHLRGPASYVLIRRDEDGSEFITGNNGTQSWSIPPRGRVRVSSDPTRYRGPVPGQQHAIPFLDLRENLNALREAYDLEVDAPSGSASDLEGRMQLTATRKDNVRRGPKRVVIWYTPETGIIQRMLLDRLPRAKGGPTSVRMELVDQGDLGSDFYEHASHHGPEREVVQD